MKLDLLQIRWSLSLRLVSTIILLVIITLHVTDSLFAEMDSIKYVTPSGKVACHSEQRPCFTLDVFASKPTNAFLNNSIFYLLPGNHRINCSITFINVQNLSL